MVNCNACPSRVTKNIEILYQVLASSNPVSYCSSNLCQANVLSLVWQQSATSYLSSACCDQPLKCIFDISDDTVESTFIIYVTVYVGRLTVQPLPIKTCSVFIHLILFILILLVLLVKDMIECVEIV